MSSNIFRIIDGILTALVKESSTSKPNIPLNATVLGVAGGIHALYAYGTSKTEEITIVSKYQIVNHGFTQFMIHDEKGRHYAVNNSLWYWKWDSIEDWSSMYKGDRIKVHYYGIRSPLFGLFPNIVGNETELQPRKWSFE
jgi:hypothetical protein